MTRQHPLLRTMRLYVLLTQAHCRIPIVDAAKAAVRGGADVVQLREKDAPDTEIIRMARTLRALTAEAGVGFIVNDRADIARLVEADGVHLGQEDLHPAAARKVLADWQIVGVSTHSLDQARLAVQAGADYIGVGPVFPTATRGYANGVGIEYVKAAAEAVSVPLVAIGGITITTAAQVAGCVSERPTAVAVCSAILMADDIEAATAHFRKNLTFC